MVPSFFYFFILGEELNFFKAVLAYVITFLPVIGDRINESENKK